jgi:hypothetical protein
MFFVFSSNYYSPSEAGQKSQRVRTNFNIFFMKKHFKFLSFLLLSLCLVLNSCSTEDEDLGNNKEVSLQKSKSIGIESSMLALSDVKFEELDEDTAKTLILPIIVKTVAQLESEGISKEEIIEEFGSLENPELIYMSVAMVAADNVDIQSDTVDCILRATGIQAIHEAFWGNFTNRRVLLRAVGRLATRAAGWIGAALIVADFVLCMNDN